MAARKKEAGVVEEFDFVKLIIKLGGRKWK
jgi:hypothetical protein